MTSNELHVISDTRVTRDVQTTTLARPSRLHIFCRSSPKKPTVVYEMKKSREVKKEEKKTLIKILFMCWGLKAITRQPHSSSRTNAREKKARM